MATSPDYYSTYEHSPEVSNQSGASENREVTQQTRAMEVKADLITNHNLGQAGQDTKQRAERISELQERRRGLQTLLNTRLAELKRVCLQEAELIGEVPAEFPLEAGERPPFVRRRGGSSRHGHKHTHAATKGEEDEANQRKLKKTLFSGTLRRHDSEPQPPQSKRTVHRGCHTDNSVRSESSSTSDSMAQDNDEVFSPDGVSPSRPRVTHESPDSRFCRKLSPVEIYYEMRTRRNSLASSASPSRSLPRSVSNLEGRSVPATPLLARTGPGPITAHIRSEVSKQQWSDNPDAPNHHQQVALQPLQSHDGGSSSSSQPGSLEQQGGGSSSSSSSNQTRRSNSSEALLDRTVCMDNTNNNSGSGGNGGGGGGGGGQRNGMPVRGGPYKSSEALTDGRLRQAQRGSPDRLPSNGGGGHPLGGDPPAANRTSVGGGGGGRAGAGNYSEILLDYVWGKQQQQQQQKMQQQQRMQPLVNGKARPRPEGSSGPPPPPHPLPSHYHNGYPHPPPPPMPTSSSNTSSSSSQSQQQQQPPHLSGGPPAYSPHMLRGKPGEPRRVKVSRTKSCGPFIPLQQHQQESNILLSAYPGGENNHPPPANLNGLSPAAPPYPQHKHGGDQAPGSQNVHRSQHQHQHQHQHSTDSTASTPDDATRSLHKALALEGLRDWYLRNTLGHPPGTTMGGSNNNNASKNQEGAPQNLRRRTTNSMHGCHGSSSSSQQQHPPLTHQPKSFQGGDAPAVPHYNQCHGGSQLPHSQTFHGHPLHGRSVDLSLYQDSFPSKMQELNLKEPSVERPSPGTLV